MAVLDKLFYKWEKDLFESETEEEKEKIVEKIRERYFVTGVPRPMVKRTKKNRYDLERYDYYVKRKKIVRRIEEQGLKLSALTTLGIGSNAIYSDDDIMVIPLTDETKSHVESILDVKLESIMMHREPSRSQPLYDFNTNETNDRLKELGLEVNDVLGRMGFDIDRILFRKNYRRSRGRLNELVMFCDIIGIDFRKILIRKRS